MGIKDSFKGSLEPGTGLFGYLILELISEGSWAYIYKAQDMTLPRLAAIKQLKPELVENEKALELFLREANIVAQINHPNIVTIHALEYDAETNSHYIITEFAERGSLTDRLEKSPGGLPIDEILDVAMGICNGLEAAHRVGVVHRDIKPGNVLLFDVGDDQEIPKLCDFGIARTPTSIDATVSPTSLDAVSSSTTGMVGTAQYMPPEQWEGIEIDHRSDLYSLGVLLYELLTGQPPFTGEIHEVAFAHVNTEPPLPRKFRPEIPEPLEQIVLRVLCKNPDGRYQSAAEMRKELEAMMNASFKEKRQREFEALLEQGLVYLEEEKWEAAIDALEQANALEPENEHVQEELQKAHEQQKRKQLYELGIQQMEKENWEEAREYLASVIRADLDYAEGYARKLLEQVTQELKRERTRHDFLVQYRVGMGYFSRQQWDMAIEELEKVVIHDPEFEDAPTRLAEAREYAKAEQLVERARRHKERGEWKEAEDIIEEVSFLRLPYLNVTDELEQVRIKRREVTKEHELDAWYAKGIAYLPARRFEQARESFEKIQERQPDYRDVQERLEEIEREIEIEQLFGQISEHEAAGEWEQVIKVCREVLDIDPFNQEATRCLERAQRRARGKGTGPGEIVTAVRNWWKGRDRRVRTVVVNSYERVSLEDIIPDATKKNLSALDESWAENAFEPVTPDEVIDFPKLEEPWEDYYHTLERLEDISLERWESLSRQTSWSFVINMVMSLGLFLVGTAIIIWGLWLLTRSSDPAQQIGGGVLSALAALATTYSSRFWKDPVEHIQKFSAQQACLQAVFIGYMNRVAQLRLAFAHRYEKKGKIRLSDLEAYQRMLSEAVAQAWQQLADHSPPSTSAEITSSAQKSTAPSTDDHSPAP